MTTSLVKESCELSGFLKICILFGNTRGKGGIYTKEGSRALYKDDFRHFEGYFDKKFFPPSCRDDSLAIEMTVS
jgi:hypothetical protein